ncbi:hypothetical protein B0A55_13758 [Friedmanniomyces simplex]|uniref:PNPLA domain-containing protein n=1 Tax=Friedmanniomyces simplex TaxID=329884 RepID=A0A4V5NAH3_9PEZI|nr:hypothetical protein B0A55_13758 [Friedmanniomyces simplex]
MQIRYASHAPNTISATASAPSLPDDHYFDPSIGSSGIPSTRSMDHEQTAASASGDWSSRRVSDHQLEMSAIASGNFWSGYVDDPWWPCILALDGGGIRGYSSLLILKALMHDVWLWEQKLQDEKSHRESVVSAPSARLPVDEDALLPCHYFDFMFGTSSGGIIATLLGRLRLTVNESLAIYRRLGEDMFGRRRSRLPLATKYYHEPLEEAIKDAVRSRYDKHTFREGIDDLFPLDADHLEEMLQRPVPFDVDDPRVCHSCCVTATHAEETESAQAHLLRTYPHYYSENTSNWITRYNEGADKLPIWKVVRATSATPFYFEMVTHEVDGVKKTFKDGGIRENNPSFAAYSEFRALYESRAGEPALLLSVGAGRYDPAPALGLFGRLPFLSTYLETQRIIQNLTVKYAEGEGQHRFLRGRAGGENFWYKRMDVAGMEKMQQDEWVKGKYMGRKSVPGGATLTAIEEATKRDLQRRFDGRFDSYASPPMVRDQTAEKLVRQRRARERLGGPRWAKFVGLADNLIAK